MPFACFTHSPKVTSHFPEEERQILILQPGNVQLALQYSVKSALGTFPPECVSFKGAIKDTSS